MPSLTRLQEASSALSQQWKKQSRSLLLGAKNLQEFKDAVVWCGKAGNVIRTVESGCVSLFAKHLWDNRDKIRNGKYKLSSDLPGFGLRNVRPLSWASKILHIMKPQQYPLIYDQNIRKALAIRNLPQYETRINAERAMAKSMSDNDLFEYDSDWWASVL